MPPPPAQAPAYEVKHTDMNPEMRDVAIQTCVDGITSEKSESAMATKIKTTFDSIYPDIKWHCLVGKTYGGYFTHDPGTFMHIQVDKEVAILFRAS